MPTPKKNTIPTILEHNWVFSRGFGRWFWRYGCWGIHRGMAWGFPDLEQHIKYIPKNKIHMKYIPEKHIHVG